MVDPGDGKHELAALLQEMKGRAGLSYTQLAHRAFVSRASVHRYCRGEAIPRDFAVIAGLARICGADSGWQARLAHAWAAAVDAPPDPPDPPSAPAGRRLGGWVQHPEPVPAAAVGVTVNSNTGAMPGFGVGAVRLWDSRTRWANLEPRRGEFDWAPLDRLVAGAAAARLPVLMTLGGTPGWAAPHGARTVYADDSRSAPPDDPADWERFLTALGRRCRGRIEAYELWDSGTNPVYFSGTPEQLAELTARAAAVLRRADPGARIASPSMGRLHTASSLRFAEAFARHGGFAGCDALALKVPHGSGGPPEALAAAVADAVLALRRLGIGGPVWITGPDDGMPLGPSWEGAAARDRAVRWFLAALYCGELGVQRCYFYNWGGGRIPVVLQVEGSGPTPAARGVGTLHRWLSGARLSGFARGGRLFDTADAPSDAPSPVGDPVGGVWRCRLDGAEGRPGPAVIAWAAGDGGAVSVRSADGCAVAVARLDGTEDLSPGGAPVRLDGSPVLLRRAGRGPQTKKAFIPGTSER